MTFIIAAVARVVSGFLYGAGFIMAVAVVWPSASAYMESDVEEKQTQWEDRAKERDEEMRRMFREYDESANLSVSISKERIESEGFTLLGTVENKGDASWSSVSLKAELFNEAGEFIEECTEYVNQTSAPGSVINFKLSCGSCTKFQLRDYKSYKLTITDARYSR